LAVLLFLGMALWLSYEAAAAVESGSVDFQSRRVGHIFASRAFDPAAFWLLIIAEYGAGLLFASYGVAIFRRWRAHES